MWRTHLRAASTLVSRLVAAPKRIAARDKRERLHNAEYASEIVRRQPRPLAP
jgi:hypothetical protein